MRKTIVYLGVLLASFTFDANAATSNETVNHSVTVSTPTPLCTAIAKGEVEIVKKFIEYGADVNERSNGMTPLMYAARYNRTDIMEILLQNGANVNAKSKNGFTALKHAELSNATAAMEMLRNYRKK